MSPAHVFLYYFLPCTAGGDEAHPVELPGDLLDRRPRHDAIRVQARPHHERRRPRVGLEEGGGCDQGPRAREGKEGAGAEAVVQRGEGQEPGRQALDDPPSGGLRLRPGQRRQALLLRLHFLGDCLLCQQPTLDLREKLVVGDLLILFVFVGIFVRALVATFLCTVVLFTLKLPSSQVQSNFPRGEIVKANLT